VQRGSGHFQLRFLLPLSCPKIGCHELMQAECYEPASK
jgi:hypothetical protein